MSTDHAHLMVLKPVQTSLLVSFRDSVPRNYQMLSPWRREEASVPVRHALLEAFGNIGEAAVPVSDKQRR